MSIIVLVADGSRARFLSAEEALSELTETADFVHPESRLRQQDLVSDGSGSGKDSGGYGMHSMGHENEAHRRQHETFARELCREIDRLRNAGELRRFYLVAPPGFLGQLRAAMDKQCAELIAGEIDKNLVTRGLDEIRAQLPKRL